MPRKYPLPDCLGGEAVSEGDFCHWLHWKAVAHAKRDKERGMEGATTSAYKQAIYDAVIEAGGRDYYTGRPLAWWLIRQWNNAEAAKKRRGYKKDFWDLPTVDHENPASNNAVFRLCSWRVNDAKNDQTITEFLELADAIRSHCGKQAR